MDSCASHQVKPSVRSSQPLSLEEVALLRLSSAAQIPEDQILQLRQDFQVSSFHLGEQLLAYSNVPDHPKSVHSEPIASDLFLVCQGRVRLLSFDPNRQRMVSIAVLEAGDTFGGDDRFGDCPLMYQAIAAEAGEVARISVSALAAWLEKLPQLRDVLVRQAIQREQLIFLRTQTTFGIGSALKGEAPTSYQIQQILPLIELVPVAAGTNLAQIPAYQSGTFWLRQGEIDSMKAEVPAPKIGDRWGYPQSQPTDWSAKTDLLIYKLPLEHWDSAIALMPRLADMPSAQSEPSTSQPEARDRLQRFRQRAPRLRTPRIDPSNSTGEAAQAESESSNPDRSTSGVIVPFPQPAKSRRWRLRLLKPFPFIQQQSSSDCGVACLAMIGQYWGKRLSINALRELAKVGRSGASLRSLAAAAERVGLQARPVRASLGRLEDQRNPWVAHWQGDHYVVVYRVSKHQVIIADPARGKRKLPRQEFLQHWTGFALLLEPTSELKKAPAGKRNLSQFWRLFWNYRSTLWQIILISLLLQLFGLVTPLFTQVILDRVVTQKSLPMLHVFALGLILFSVWRVGLVMVRQYLLDYFSNRLDLTMVSGFISHTLRLPLKFFETRQVGDVITRVQENNKIQMFLTRQAVATWLDALMAVVYLGLMFYYNWRLALLVVGLIPPFVILTLVATPFLRQISREVFTEAAEQNSLLVEMLTGVETVKSAAAEREVRWRWEEHLTSMLNLQFKGQKFANGLQGVSGLINAIGSTALLWYGATLVIQGQLTIGQFVAFNMLIGNVISPVLSLVELWDEFQEVLISVERLNDVLEATPEEVPGQPMLVLPPVQGEVQFDNVTFRYDDSSDRNTLQNLSIEVKAGQTIAIVGRSGSGKSTLVKLLQGLYHPNSGRIWIDGHDIRHVSPDSLRSQLGVVSQECFLFSGTIQENIQLYRSEYGLEQVIEVAKLAEAHGFIQDLPLGYNTKVGERGANLSGGQRQRIAIARALLGNPPILILDEATSSLDTESERRFQQNLTRFCRGRTTFIIAHRLSTVRHVDRILVLDQGVLVEQGTHDELIALKGLYYHLAQQQLEL